ncbi:MAG: 2-amino-4-hydroxy-6-hydroxymethyldihydropteridine diphosphokinase [Chloroflexi bacterium]|nr:2-amino-4-hydroxy-6-hydroxymethyldihydropteridine diphosphokinase [Chloroflexota bacterium]
MVPVYLSLGSNLGDRQANLDKAIGLISNRMRLGQVSSIYETEPVGNVEQPRFLNLACQVFTRLAPKDLLSLVKGFEAMLGRARNTHNAPRTIDIDILFYGNQIIESEELTIPHPRLAERAFVLAPLAEIAPDLVHPITGKTVAEMLKDLPNTRGVVKLEKKVEEK